MILALPLAFRPTTRPVFVGVFVSAWVAITATMVYVAWWAHRSGIPNNADLRSLFFRPSTDRRFWKRPQMARQLLAPGAGSVRSPTTPAEYVRHIVESTQRMTGQTRDAGLSASEVARLAFATLTELDREIAALGKEHADATAVTRLDAATDQRKLVAEGLDALWRDHVRALNEPTDAGARRLTGTARSLEQDLGSGRPPDAPADSETIGPNTGEALDRTR